MKKLTALILAAALLAVSGCTGPGPDAPPASPPPGGESPGILSAADYLSFEGDVRMTYEGQGNEFAGMVTHVDYTGDGVIQLRGNNTGTETVDVIVAEGGAVKRVFSRGETYFRYNFTDMRAMEEVLIQEPVAVGTTWTLPSGDTRTITGTDATVTVPQGTFTALEVTTQGAHGTLRDYYAPGVGLVRREYVPAGDTLEPIVSALAAVERGQPLVQTVSVFYPDFSSEETVSVNETVELFTGDDIGPKFESLFKNPPKGSGLTPVLTPGAKINAITLDLDSGAVTVDVSEEFITEMVAGAALEGLILRSLANTLGTYFMTEQVFITVDGGPYESGHFLFYPGDPLPFEPEAAGDAGN